MIMPKLKRIKVSSQHQLQNWLAANSGDELEVMIVTCNEKSQDKHVSREDVHDALARHGWAAGPRFTLKSNLVGQVISHSVGDRS